MCVCVCEWVGGWPNKHTHTTSYMFAGHKRSTSHRLRTAALTWQTEGRSTCSCPPLSHIYRQ